MAAELPVSQVLMKEKEPKKEMKKTKVAGWSTEKMDEKASRAVVQGRGRNGAMEEHQSGRNWQCGKYCRKIEEAVPEKYKVEVSKRAYSGRGEPSEWRMVQRVKEYQP